MFGSKVSDYNIVARTPYKRGVLKALAEECRRQGVKLFLSTSGRKADRRDGHGEDCFH